MSLWSDLRSTLRSILVIEEKIDRLSAVVEKMAGHVEDHEKRLIRIETLIELARERRLPRRRG